MKLDKPPYSNKTLFIKKYCERSDSLFNMARLISRYLKRGDKILDIGASFGQFCLFLNYFGFESYGIEPLDEEARYARANNIVVYTSSFPNNIPSFLLQMKYSCITMMESIYYLSDWRKSLYKANTMLEDGGLLLIKSHLATSKFYKHKKSLLHRFGNNVTIFPTQDSIRVHLKAGNFKIIYTSVVPLKLSKNNSRLFLVLNKLHSLLPFDGGQADRIIIIAKKQ